MSITVEQSMIDAYLDRIHRFIDNVNQFKERLSEMMSQRGPVDGDEAGMRTTYSQQTAAYQETSDSGRSLTADEVDIDALLSDIGLGDEFSL